MATRSLRTRLLRTAMTLAVGGSVFQLSGCDPAVRTELLTGLEDTTNSLLTALSSAFFLSLQDDSSSTDTSLTTTGGTTP